jgi:hypothetical protein
MEDILQQQTHTVVTQHLQCHAMEESEMFLLYGA